MFKLARTGGKDIFEQLRQEIDQAFGRWIPALPRQTEDLFGNALATGTVPALELEEDAEELHLKAELPGLTKDEFSVEILDNRLTLKGEKKSRREEKKGGAVYSECSYGAFTRTITLPSEVNAEKCRAELKDGVLQLHLPKVDSAKQKSVKVKVS